MVIKSACLLIPKLNTYIDGSSVQSCSISTMEWVTNSKDLGYGVCSIEQFNLTL